MHKSVLLNEVIEILNPRPGDNFIDCNLGFAGHTKALLEKTSPSGKVLGIEADQRAIAQLKSEIASNDDLQKRLIITQGNFVDLKEIQEAHDFSPIQGILFDLGLSSWQLEQSNRGFSFLKDEPLLMNYQEDGLTAQEIVNEWPEKELADLIYEYGEERYSRKIARNICNMRKQKAITRTSQLVEAIKYAVPGKYRRSNRIHFATRTFQALRIVVNQELDSLEKVLPQAFEILETGNRLAVISFHSLEDRIVKNFLRDHKEDLDILTKKPIVASEEEIKFNPRSRSAKLRAAIKK